MCAISIDASISHSCTHFLPFRFTFPRYILRIVQAGEWKQDAVTSAERLNEVAQQQIDEGANMTELALSLSAAEERATELEMRVQEAEGETELWRGEANLHKEQVAASELQHDELLGELQLAHEQLEQERSTVTKLRTEVARVAVEMKQIEAERDRATEEAQAARSVTSIARREADTVKAELTNSSTAIASLCETHGAAQEELRTAHAAAIASESMSRAAADRAADEAKLQAKLLEGELETAQLLAQTWKGRTERLVVRAKAVAAAGATDKLPCDLDHENGGDDSATSSSSNSEHNGKLSSNEQLKELARQQLAQLSSLELELSLAEESVLHSEEQRKTERERFEVSAIALRKFVWRAP